VAGTEEKKKREAEKKQKKKKKEKKKGWRECAKPKKKNPPFQEARWRGLDNAGGGGGARLPRMVELEARVFRAGDLGGGASSPCPMGDKAGARWSMRAQGSG